MKFLSLLISASSALALPAVSAKLLSQTTTTFTQLLCLTHYGTKSVQSIPTSTYAVTISFKPTVVSTYTRQVTKTPCPTTVSVIITSTAVETPAAITDIITSTEVDTETDTITTISTIVALTTTTSTVVVSTTTTVPVAAGFVYPTAGINNKRSLERNKASLEEKYNMQVRARRNLQARDKAVRCLKPNPKPYAQYVVCKAAYEVILPQTVVKTASKAQTVSAATPTITKSLTVEITSTADPLHITATALTKITVTTIQTVAAYVTTISTVTETKSNFAATQTYYAACGSQNQVSSLNGNQISLSAIYGDDGPIISSSTDAYSCCAACFATTGCATYNYIPAFGSSACQINVFNSCPAGQKDIGVTYSQSSAIPVTIGNGPCGKVSYVS